MRGRDETTSYPLGVATPGFESPTRGVQFSRVSRNLFWSWDPCVEVDICKLRLVICRVGGEAPAG